MLLLLLLLLDRHDSDLLLFPSNLLNLTESSRIGLDLIYIEINNLRNSNNNNTKFCEKHFDELTTNNDNNNIISNNLLLFKSFSNDIEKLSSLYDNVYYKYTNTLNYFCEDNNMKCSGFIIINIIIIIYIFNHIEYHALF